ncbi:MAG: hypothetical protein AAGH15_19910 [Myxococcota bacterium]
MPFVLSGTVHAQASANTGVRPLPDGATWSATPLDGALARAPRTCHVHVETIGSDRVLEDRILIAAREEGGRRFRARISVVFWFFLRKLWQRLRGRFVHFGTAAVVYGQPLHLTDYADDTPVDAIAADLMAGIAGAMPILGVPIVAQVFLDADTPLSRADIDLRAKARAEALGATLLSEDGAWIADALERLRGRQLVAKTHGAWAAVADEKTLLAYYAASLGHLSEMARAAQ